MDIQYSSLKISIPKFKLSNIERGVYLYEIDIATRWAKWHLQKRMSDFQQLNNLLSKQFSDLPEFPFRLLSIILGDTEQERQQDRQTLQQYLRDTSLRPDIINSKQYSEFLQIDKHSPLMLAKKPTLLGEFMLEERINDEGKIIVDFYCHPCFQFFVFATGNISPLEKWNAIIANTKFPWEDDEEAEFVLPLGTVECYVKKSDYHYQRMWARNYPNEVKKLIFSPSAETMVVGLDNGEVEVFRLHTRANHFSYEVIRIMTVHQEELTGLYLDEVNKILYSTGADGWLNIIDSRKAVLIETCELNVQISALLGDPENSRLFVAMTQGNIDIYQYTSRAKIKYLHSLSTPQNGPIKTLRYDNTKQYLFAGGYNSGDVWIFEIGKPGHEKISKQIGAISTKPPLIQITWIPQKMELITSTQTGEMSFWDALKGKQIYMQKAFEEQGLSHIQFFGYQNTLITSSRGRSMKFWQIPRIWRDMAAKQQQQREIQIRRKVQNLYRVRQALKLKQIDSDEDDLKFWHLDQSDDEYQYV